jgi:hypothetical protein
MADHSATVGRDDELGTRPDSVHAESDFLRDLEHCDGRSPRQALLSQLIRHFRVSTQGPDTAPSETRRLPRPGRRNAVHRPRGRTPLPTTDFMNRTAVFTAAPEFTVLNGAPKSAGPTRPSSCVPRCTATSSRPRPFPASPRRPRSPSPDRYFAPGARDRSRTVRPPRDPLHQRRTERAHRRGPHRGHRPQRCGHLH